MFESIVRAVVGGVLIGAAAALVLLAHGRIAGITGIVGRAFDHGPARSFRLPFLAGLIATGAIAAIIAPRAFGAAPPGLARLAIAGLLVGAGTTFANGCTSGHGVCGLGRGSPRSLVAVIAFMAAGMITVAIAGAT